LRSVLFTKYYSDITTRRIRFAKHVACMGKRSAYRVLVGRHKEKDYLEDSGVDGRIILKCIFNRWDEGMDWINLAQNKDFWRDECCNETSDSIKCGECFNEL
jgi:hypothetical protein